jgi:formylglycine-generating enzyme required for sulfatase activity
VEHVSKDWIEPTASFIILRMLKKTSQRLLFFCLITVLFSACIPITEPTPEATEPPPVDWTPKFQTFDGYEMVLVPSGCFIMGSDTGETDEHPVSEQCIAAPFWIDRFEVTNAQYGSAGTFAGDNRPRDSVAWQEASMFCAGRNGRLPTEVEWEYAARGSNNRVYPWGNHFNPDNVIFDATSGMQSAEVGSRPQGASWVGAEDMSGNLWEWTSTVYRFYPYSPDDGRESQNEFFSRVVRGGSWVSDQAMVRSANRAAFEPAQRDPNNGFRCVHDDVPNADSTP